MALSNERQSDLLIGVDIGGTKCAAVVGNGNGDVLARRFGPTPKGAWEDAVRLLMDLIHGVCADFGVAPRDCAAIGASCGGPVDTRNGAINAPPNLPNWTSVPIRSLFENEFAIPVFIENDANATAIAEHRWGAGVGVADMAFLTMGTGIGAGLILNGKLYRGRSDLAGEIGHVVVRPDGALCACGKRGCLEAYASGSALTRIGRDLYGDENITSEVVCDRARQGDPIAIGVIDEAASCMGLALANLLQTLNLQRIVLGTLAVHAGDLLLPPIREAASANCWPNIWRGVTIVAAALGPASQDRAALAVALRVESARGDENE